MATQDRTRTDSGEAGRSWSEWPGSVPAARDSPATADHAGNWVVGAHGAMDVQVTGTRGEAEAI